MDIQEKIYYAGIGSRETPEDVKKLFEKTGKQLATKGYVLRSGGAEGADLAFERGCDEVQGEKEIFIPWKGLNNSDSKYILRDPEAYRIAQQFHPRFQKLGEKAQKLQARNTHQVLGWDLKTKSHFIICWTILKNGKAVGGTAQALRIAEEYGIPSFNAGKYGDVQEMERALDDFLKKH